MPILDFIITVFCLIDDEYKQIPNPIRKRGFKPALSDSEVITMEIVGDIDSPPWKKDLIPWEEVMIEPDVNQFAKNFYLLFDWPKADQ